MDELNILKSNLELFKKLNPLDCAVMITDAEGTILEYVRGKSFDLNITINSKASEKGAVGRCINTGKEVIMNLPKDLYGLPIKSIAAPIFVDNKMIGAIATSTTLLAQETLQGASQNISSASQEITATSEEIASSASLLSKNLEDLKLKVEDVTNEIKKTDDILRFINELSSNSNLLGLNAAIEAARAGEHGRGFAVVSQEIRKMADNSANSVKDVKNILKSIKEKSSAMLELINETSGIGANQSIATNEISSAIQQLSSSALNLEEVSKII
jgi:transcriptional regulator of acetoin/glycerol metabolism